LHIVVQEHFAREKVDSSHISEFPTSVGDLYHLTIENNRFSLCSFARESYRRVTEKRVRDRWAFPLIFCDDPDGITLCLKASLSMAL
jgi:hypothetical protein